VEPEVHPTALQGYGRAAETYARARPSAPDAAVDWLVSELGEPARVVEIGAGTGKLTARLAERQVEVVAVEPVAAMRERLAALGPLVTPLDAIAESLPLQSGTVDALVASQSLHWTDVAVALAEFDRVLRPTGAVGLIWNLRDVAVPWQRDLDALLTELRGDAPHSRDGRWQRAVRTSAFEATASRTWRWSATTNAVGVLERVRSVSYVAALSEDRQRRVDERVLDLLRDHCFEAEGGSIAFPYVTEAHVLRRRGAAPAR
jgi:SAM-dependent methyltransferase